MLFFKKGKPLERKLTLKNTKHTDGLPTASGKAQTQGYIIGLKSTQIQFGKKVCGRNAHAHSADFAFPE